MDDKRLTQKLIEAGKLMDVKVLDHLIITSDNFYSFADHNLM
ncbi:DNA repair protein radC [Nonlabens ulvanivorans]|nr:DNA repair protein radC [Nonlabens ulvanivorans]